jgi:hypothetical protein
MINFAGCGIGTSLDLRTAVGVPPLLRYGRSAALREDFGLPGFLHPLEVVPVLYASSRE